MEQKSLQKFRANENSSRTLYYDGTIRLEMFWKLGISPLQMYIHTPVFEVRCVLRQREINWGRRLGNDAITAGYEEHMRRSLADEGRDSLQLRPITNCSSSAEPDEYLHFWKKKKNKCKTYFLSFFGVSTKIEGNWFQIARRWDSWVWLCPGEGIYKSR